MTTSAALALAGSAMAQDLPASLSDFEPLIGHWEVEGEWTMGGTIAANAEYIPTLGGRMLVAPTFVSDNGQPMYERYWSVMRVLESGELEATHFGYDGNVNTVVHTPTETEAGLALDATWEMQSPMGAATIDERLVVAEDACPWTVKITPAGMSEPIGWLVAEWTRTDAFDRPAERPDAIADEGLKPMERLIGTWTIDAEWSDGSTLEATNEYRVGVGGMFIEVDTFASDGGGEQYHRYHSVYDYDAETDGVVAYGFDFMGERATVAIELTDNGLITRSERGPMEIYQTIEFTDEDTMHWIVKARPAGSDGDWMPMMDGEWKRQS